MEIPSDHWPIAPPIIALLSQEIHLWFVDLESAERSDGVIEGYLSDDEVVRAKRFYFKRHQECFVRARGALRSILARYIPFTPEKIIFSYQPNGRPELAAVQNKIGLNFNVSHSGELAIIAVSVGRRIGIDIERYRDLECLEIARRYFSESEYRQLSALPGNELQKNFFACWTRKEAFLKALGEGIGALLPQVSMTVDHRQPPKLIEFQSEPEAPLRWSLMDIGVREGYAAALASEGGPVEIRQYKFSK